MVARQKPPDTSQRNRMGISAMITEDNNYLLLHV